MPQQLPIDSLVPHPENANRMDNETLLKLRRHIESTGRYEPVTVRPHPTETDKFQIINGHHRVRALRNIGHQGVSCVVWDVDDRQTRLYLATLNRLCGKDIPERRTMLLAGLIDDFELMELAKLLPENLNQLQTLEKAVHSELESLDLDSISDETAEIPVILSFMLPAGLAAEVNRALDMVIESSGNGLSRSSALHEIARSFIERR